MTVGPHHSQVEDTEAVAEVRRLYQTALKLPGLLTGMGRLKKDHRVLMTGKSLILTNQGAFVEG